MLTPNGGVFGRNPKFQNVTVENNLIVNGDFTLGDDIVINDTLLVNGVATFKGGIISTGTAAAPTSNTVLGTTAGAALQSGATDNVLLGATAGDSITTGDQCIVIGSGADVAAATNSNSIVIGHGAVGNGSNTTTIGNSSTTGTFIPAGDLTLTNGNFIVGTSGKGIDFSATANSSGTMTSELLSDYEEGTWTPVYSATGTGFTTMTMNTTTAGRYTKVGRLVTVSAYLLTNNVDAAGATGNVTISGLPFTVAATVTFPAGCVGLATGWAAAGFPSAVYAQDSTAILNLVKRANANGTTALVVPNDFTAGAISGQNELLVSVSYIA